MFHIYCGDGKGKTTASLGLALRASGAGMSIHFVQFMKGSYTSELETLKYIPNLSFERCDSNYNFTFNMTNQEKSGITQWHNVMLKRAFDMADNKKINMLILDEFNLAYKFNLINKNLADELILNYPKNLELVLTGRDPDKKFINIADYVSEIKAVKHPFEKGFDARKGIEY